MIKKIGIRNESKSKFERRSPLIPEDIEKLSKELDVKFLVEPSTHRCFSSELFQQYGAEIKDDLSEADLILGIKEVPVKDILDNKIYMYFSHTIKGQSYNMPMLSALLEKKCTIIDYECIVNEEGKRLIFFGKHAGIAGMIDSLWAFGKKLALQGIENPFKIMTQALNYKKLIDVEEQLKEIGKAISENGLPKEITPLVVGFAGYGHVSQGAQSILDLLPVKEITPDDLLADAYDKTNNKIIYKVIFKESDMVKRIDGGEFNLQEYYKFGNEKYGSDFSRFLPKLNILINAIYWEEKYPRLVEEDYIKENYHNLKLTVIGDITCDVNGAIEITKKSTYPNDPVFVYDVNSGDINMGFEGDGPVVLAVDILPSEIPRTSSKFFSEHLVKFIPELVSTEWTDEFNKLKLSDKLKNAIIVYKGELTPKYSYLKKFL